MTEGRCTCLDDAWSDPCEVHKPGWIYERWYVVTGEVTASSVGASPPLDTRETAEWVKTKWKLRNPDRKIRIVREVGTITVEDDE